jgi:DNA-binding response OmpR family regulator
LGDKDITILIVDDEKINRVLLKSFMETRYGNILEAEDGNIGLKLLKEHDVDLILLDLMMPNMDGYELLKAIRSHQSYQTIPVIIITALGSVKDNAKALELGADGFLTKPFNKIILSAMTDNLLKQSSMRKKLIEIEKNEVFYATVVTANHEINQPLTGILCSANLLSNSYEGYKIRNPEKFSFYINSIEDSVKKISEALRKLRTVKDPLVKTYLDSVKMVDIHTIEPGEKACYIVKETLIKGVEKNIFILDEEPLITDVLSGFFHDKGFNVKIFSDYNEALKSLKNDPDIFDIILIDIKDPEREGLKLFYKLKEIKSDVKVILSSAYDMKEDIVSAINSGAEAFLPKPYDINDLMFLVEKALGADKQT